MNNLDSVVNPQISLDHFGSFFDAIGVSFFVQDLQWKLLECNDYQAKLAGFDSQQQMHGLALDEFAKLHHWEGQTIESLLMNNHEVLSKDKKKLFQEYMVLNGKPYYFFCQKSPLKSLDNRIIGLMGVSINMTEFVSRKHSLRMIIRNSLPTVSLTSRELDCLVYYIQGYTSKMIAKKLNISYHTVNENLTKIKYKSGCQNKADLLTKIFYAIFQHA